MRMLKHLIALLLLSLSLPLFAGVTASYVPDTASKGIWYTWNDLPADIRSRYAGVGNDHLFYHLGKLTVDVVPEDDDPVRGVYMQCVFGQRIILSTPEWQRSGSTQSSEVYLGVSRVIDNAQQAVDSYYGWADTDSSWMEVTGSDNHLITRRRHVDIEFYLITWGTNFFTKEEPIFFKSVDLLNATLTYAYDDSGATAHRKAVSVDGGDDTFNFWGDGKPEPQEDTWRSDSEHAHGRESSQQLLLDVTENNADLVRGDDGKRVAALLLSTNDAKPAVKDYPVTVVFHDDDVLASDDDRYFYLRRGGDKQNPNYVRVALRDGDGNDLVNSASEGVAWSVAKGTQNLQKYLRAYPVWNDVHGQAAGTYVDTVFVDIITGDT